MVGMMRTIRRMQIDHDVGIVIVQQFHHRSRFGRVELDVVAIDIETLGIRANPHPANRAMLRTAVRQ